MRTQTERVLAYLRSGETLTPIQALGIIGTMRLGARIYDARKLLEPGEVIIREWYETPGGARVARYRLIQPEPVQIAMAFG